MGKKRSYQWQAVPDDLHDRTVVFHRHAEVALHDQADPTVRNMIDIDETPA